MYSHLTLTNTFSATNACDPNPCRNGARCSDVKGEAVCKCQPRYHGERCEGLFLLFSNLYF